MSSWFDDSFNRLQQEAQQMFGTGPGTDPNWKRVLKGAGALGGLAMGARLGYQAAGGGFMGIFSGLVGGTIGLIAGLALSGWAGNGIGNMLGSDSPSAAGRRPAAEEDAGTRTAGGVPGPADSRAARRRGGVHTAAGPEVPEMGASEQEIAAYEQARAQGRLALRQGARIYGSAAPPMGREAELLLGFGHPMIREIPPHDRAPEVYRPVGKYSWNATVVRPENPMR